MRGTIYVTLPLLLAATIGCGTGVKGESSNATEAPPAIAVSSAAAVEKPIRRVLEVTGTLAAEAGANAAQIVGRLGLADGSEFAVDKVPEVANARANLDLAEGDFARAQMLFDKKLLSKADFDTRSAQAE